MMSRHVKGPCVPTCTNIHAQTLTGACIFKIISWQQSSRVIASLPWDKVTFCCLCVRDGKKIKVTRSTHNVFVVLFIMHPPHCQDEGAWYGFTPLRIYVFAGYRDVTAPVLRHAWGRYIIVFLPLLFHFKNMVAIMRVIRRWRASLKRLILHAAFSGRQKEQQHLSLWRTVFVIHTCIICIISKSL